MTEKQAHALTSILSAIPDEAQRGLFGDLAETAMSLGYMPVLKGAKASYVDFIKGKIRRSLMKIDTDPKFPPRVAVRYFAAAPFTPFLRTALIGRITPLLAQGHKAACYGCGQCDGSQMYTFSFDDGTPGAWCGKDLITLPPFTAAQLPELREALRAQDAFFMAHLA